MNNIIISQALLVIAILATGVVYGTDMFYALVVRKAITLSKDSSIADLVTHMHLIADGRMPGIGATSILCTVICIILNLKHAYVAYLSGAALLMLLSCLCLHIIIAKSIYKKMSDAANDHAFANIRALQNRWESVINYRAVLLTAAMLLLTVAAIACSN